MDACEARASDLVAVNLPASHLRGQHAHLGQRLSEQQRSAQQRREQQPSQNFHSHL
jgi:hypothetical protein